MNVLSTPEGGEAAENAELLEGNSSPSELLSDKSEPKVLSFFLLFPFCEAGGVFISLRILAFAKSYLVSCFFLPCFYNFFVVCFSWRMLFFKQLKDVDYRCPRWLHTKYDNSYEEVIVKLVSFSLFFPSPIPCLPCVLLFCFSYLV